MTITGLFVSIAPADKLETMREIIETWIADDEHAALIDDGTTDKRDLGYLMIEFEEAEPTDAFLRMLSHEHCIEDYTLYVRKEGGRYGK